jgi:hypothetical protein
MNKCTWKDGKFEGCEIHKEILNDRILIKNPKRLFDDRVIFCPFCGADIRKPEEKPLIVKSGGAWVVNNFGMDYLFLGHDITNINMVRTFFNAYNREENELFIPFTKITLTDNIAKLRPMVKVWNNSLNPKVTDTLVYIDDHNTLDQWNYITKNNTWANCRLATPHELQEQEK